MPDVLLRGVDVNALVGSGRAMSLPKMTRSICRLKSEENPE